MMISPEQLRCCRLGKLCSVRPCKPRKARKRRVWPSPNHPQEIARLECKVNELIEIAFTPGTATATGSLWRAVCADEAAPQAQPTCNTPTDINTQVFDGAPCNGEACWPPHDLQQFIPEENCGFHFLDRLYQASRLQFSGSTDQALGMSASIGQSGINIGHEDPPPQECAGMLPQGNASTNGLNLELDQAMSACECRSEADALPGNVQGILSAFDEIIYGMSQTSLPAAHVLVMAASDFAGAA
ncbi:hypothetical protein ACCO45_009920 [Purpureocillium lilacinum]|uniref:Uncharacterized protein n=1 Tax=Purpureocillium lilacinum TaxID=33203 RepID=A0ACC4DDZ6_PURLI